jgi:hypothetical protein
MHRYLAVAFLLVAALSCGAESNTTAINADFEIRPLTSRGLENLIAFTRLYGMVRFFHASDESAAADWDAIAVNGAARVESAKNESELATRLNEIFLPIAPAVRIDRTNAKPRADITKPSGADTLMAWEHNGVGLKDKGANIIYSSGRVRRSLEYAEPGYRGLLQPIQVDLGGGVSASIPLAVYADATSTLPRPIGEALPFPVTTYSGNDRATRLGDVVILWNVLQHFYPYFDVVRVNWPAELRAALRDAAEDRDEAAFLRTLRLMIVSIEDGHGSVSHPALMRRAYLPILWRAIGDALVVTTIDETVTDLNVGDEVVAIDGKPVLQALRDTEALISGSTPQWRRWTALRHLLAGQDGTQAALTIRNADASTRTVSLTRTIRPEPLREKRPGKTVELKPGLWYVDFVETFKDPDFEASLEKLANARGIVFDVRGYPRLGSKPLQHLIDGIAESARWNIPILRRPDFQGVEWNTDGRWIMEPLTPRLTKNIVFLTDGRAISYAESWMGIVEAYNLGEIVGETTAGTNGNVNIVPLPGGYRVVFTGMKTLKHDGSRHHGIGIAPTVPVSPTLAGIRAGRDEQLEKALEILESKNRENRR